MNTAKLYNGLKNYSFQVWIILIIIFTFVFLHPKMSNRLLGFKSKNLYNSFVSQVIKDGEIDAKAFWKFREFFSQGYFDFNKDYIKVSSILEIYNLDKDKNEILYFKSQRLNSTESIVKDKNFFRKDLFGCEYVIFESDKEIICRRNGGKTIISFIKNIDEMREANGLFDYLETEKELLKDKFWLNYTEITD